MDDLITFEELANKVTREVYASEMTEGMITKDESYRRWEHYQEVKKQGQSYSGSILGI